jgi:LPXTG-site transpeptidase (sortase) family protein
MIEPNPNQQPPQPVPPPTPAPAKPEAVLSEEDVKPLFAGPAPVSVPKVTLPFAPSSPARRFGRALFTFFGTFLSLFILINIPTISIKANWLFRTEIRGVSPEPNEITQELFGPAALPGVSAPKIPVVQSLEELPDDRLYFPKINVEAPIHWNTAVDRILELLPTGLTHLLGTATPSSEGGNVFITGHSSNYWWAKGGYNRVFALLDQAVAGDHIAVTFEKKKYIYKVTDVTTVNPDEVSVVANTPTPILTLMTCVPVGTNLRRLIVKAELTQVTILKGAAEPTPPPEGAPPTLPPVPGL